MTAREVILNRVREALHVQAPRPGTHGLAAAAKPSPSLPLLSQWLPAIGDAFSEHLKNFADASATLRSDFHLLEGAADLAAKLKTIGETEGWKHAASHRGELTLAACAGLGLPILWTDSGYEKRDLECCDVGISECNALIAQTGSVLVTARSAGGRALSVLPPHHVVLARREQLIRDLPAAFELLRRTYAPNYPSFMSLITGPSRTGDIERILVLGAHGPKKLTILCF